MIKSKNTLLINANVCKNHRCSNLAIANAPEYISPSYLLGFPALHCSKCNSNALLLNNDDIRLLLNPKIDFYLTHVKELCPHCHGSYKISYGKTQQQKPRLQCKICRLVYSPKKITKKQQQNLLLLCQLLLSSSDFKEIITKLKISYSHFYRLLKQLEFVCWKSKLLLESTHATRHQLHISTLSKIFLARGTPSPTQLWGITSAISDNGYILLSNLNCTKQDISSSSLYDCQQAGIPQKSPLFNLKSVVEKCDQFLQRKSFDQLVYHRHSFMNNQKEKIIEPIICAYSHFYELKQYYFSKYTYHYVEHEAVLRSAAITIYGQEVRNENCNIFYLYELSSYLKENILEISRQKIGWWQNEWYIMKNSNHDICRLMGLLVNHKKKLTESQISALPATFSGINRFYQMFDQYFSRQRLAKLSPSSIQSLLNIFTCLYNFCLSNDLGKTTAQKFELCSRRLRLDEIIK